MVGIAVDIVAAKTRRSTDDRTAVAVAVINDTANNDDDGDKEIVDGVNNFMVVEKEFFFNVVCMYK